MLWNLSAQIPKRPNHHGQKTKFKIKFSQISIDWKEWSLVSRFINSWLDDWYWARYRNLQIQLFL